MRPLTTLCADSRIGNFPKGLVIQCSYYTANPAKREGKEAQAIRSYFLERSRRFC